MRGALRVVIDDHNFILNVNVNLDDRQSHQL